MLILANKSLNNIQIMKTIKLHMEKYKIIKLLKKLEEENIHKYLMEYELLIIKELLLKY